jgi:hypothetical protein
VEHRLRVFENRMLRTFVLKRDEVICGWRKLHNEEVYNLYSLHSIIRMIKEDEMGREKRNAYMILEGKPEGKRQLRPRHRWEDKIKWILREIY